MNTEFCLRRREAWFCPEFPHSRNTVSKRNCSCDEKCLTKTKWKMASFLHHKKKNKKKSLNHYRLGPSFSELSFHLLWWVLHAISCTQVLWIYLRINLLSFLPLDRRAISLLEVIIPAVLRCIRSPESGFWLFVCLRRAEPGPSGDHCRNCTQGSQCKIHRQEIKQKQTNNII